MYWGGETPFFEELLTQTQHDFALSHMSNYITERLHRAHGLVCAGVVRPHFQGIQQQHTQTPAQEQHLSIIKIQICIALLAEKSPVVPEHFCC